MRWQAIPAVKATAAGLVLAAAALAGAAAAQAAPSAASPSLALPGRLYGVAATSTTNASAKGYWAVGSTDWARTLVRHWNGKAPKIGAAQPAGSWGRAVEVPGLGALNTGGQAGVASVSCGSAGSCTAGGDYPEPSVIRGCGHRAARPLGPGDRGARPGGPEHGRVRPGRLGVLRPGGQLRGRRVLLRTPQRAGVRGQRAARPLGPGDRGTRPGGPEYRQASRGQLGVVRLGGQLRGRRVLQPR